MSKFVLLLLGAVLAAPVSVMAVSTDESSLRALAADGWAGLEGGTHGGARASSKNIVKVSNIEGLRAALNAWPSAKIIVVTGMIDASGGKPFTSKSDQNDRGIIRIPSNTTLVGADKSSGFVNANLMIKGVDNVIVSNLAIQNPWDEFPVWDPNDGPAGHWNSDYDGISIDQGTHIWIDHVSFTDAPRTDDQNGQANGQEVQHHDGAVDIKNMSDFITISNCAFLLHDKNNLIGHSDGNKKDAGHLRITFHDNLFQDVVQRAPRVRYGRVHVYNNYYVGSTTHPIYPYMYSIGLGVESSVISEANVFEISGANNLCNVVKAYGGSVFSDARSLLNGNALQWVSACKGGKGYTNFVTPDWTPQYAYAPKAASDVAAAVRALAGPQ